MCCGVVDIGWVYTVVTHWNWWGANQVIGTGSGVVGIGCSVYGIGSQPS